MNLKKKQNSYKKVTKGAELLLCAFQKTKQKSKQNKKANKTKTPNHSICPYVLAAYLSRLLIGSSLLNVRGVRLST